MRNVTAIGAVVLAVGTLPACAGGLPSAAVPFTLGDAGAVVVPVVINGAGPFLFLLDTGSTHTSIGAALAERLATPVVARARVETAAGAALSPVVRLGTLAVGQTRAGGILATLVPDARLALTDASVAGILGQDFLARFDYTLDYRHRRIVWGAGDEGRGAVRLGLRESDGRYLVELPQGGGHRAVALVPDSGANAVVLFERPGGAPLAADVRAGRSSLSTVAGRRGVRVGTLRRLQVGGITLWDQPVAIVDRAGPEAPDGDGLLPLHLFASVSFNSRDGVLILRSR